MRKRPLLLASLAFAVACARATGPFPAPPPLPSAAAQPVSGAAATPPNIGPLPPIAKQEPKVDRVHGVDRVDDYFWLRKKDSPEVLAYLAAENAYTAEVTKATEPLQ